MEEEVKLLHLSWEDFQMLTEKVGEQVKFNGFQTDVIVAVSRGGFDPARYLCDILLVKRLASLQVEYYTTVKHHGKSPEIVFPLNANVEGLNVLLVDDVADTGDSLKMVREYVNEQGASEVRIATLHVKPWSQLTPDYYAEEVDAWIVYPWEPRETIISMAEKLQIEGLDGDKIKRKLADMGFNTYLIGRIL